MIVELPLIMLCWEKKVWNLTLSFKLSSFSSNAFFSSAPCLGLTHTPHSIGHAWLQTAQADKPSFQFLLYSLFSVYCRHEKWSLCARYTYLPEHNLRKVVFEAYWIFPPNIYLLSFDFTRLPRFDTNVMNCLTRQSILGSDGMMTNEWEEC